MAAACYPLLLTPLGMAEDVQASTTTAVVAPIQSGVAMGRAVTALQGFCSSTIVHVQTSLSCSKEHFEEHFETSNNIHGSFID